MSVTAGQMRQMYRRAAGLGDDPVVIDIPPLNPYPITEDKIVGRDQYGDPIYGWDTSALDKWLKGSTFNPQPKPVTPAVSPQAPTIKLVPAVNGPPAAAGDNTWLWVIGGLAVVFVLMRK